jgi:hypothetical protein
MPSMELLGTSNLDPWGYGDEAVKSYRKYAVLHMRLFPYRYAAAQEAARTGIPIMRALVLEDQNDQRAREAKDEYLFGPDLLAAPVIDEGTSRAVYLPRGCTRETATTAPEYSTTHMIISLCDTRLRSKEAQRMSRCAGDSIRSSLSRWAASPLTCASIAMGLMWSSIMPRSAP